MSKHSKVKGADFELLVAKMIAQTLGVTAKQCHRTPRSGGHHVKGDLVLDPALRKKFPYVVECKHTKTWTLKELLPVSAMMNKWLEQAQREAQEEEGLPLLVIRGHHTPIFCVLWSTSRALPDYIKFRWKGKELILTLFKDWLKGL